MFDPVVFGEFTITVAYACVFICAFLFVNALLKEQDIRQAEESLEEQANRKDADGLLKFTRPLFTQYVVPLVRGRPKLANLRKKYRRKLITGGMKDVLTSDEMIAFKTFLIIFFPVVGGLLNALDMIDADLWQIMGSGVAGWFYPDLWINGKIKERQKQIRKAMPFIVDLLALSTEAGLDFIGAISRVVEKASPSPLVQEFEQLLKEIRVGSSRGEAMREMAERIGMMEVNSFVAVLISADQMGASIGKVLRQQSEMVRSQRFLNAEKAGAAAAPKLMMVTALVIFPAVLLMIGAPFLLAFVTGGN